MAPWTTSLGVREGMYDYAPATGVAGAVEWQVNFADPRLFTAYGSGLFAQDERCRVRTDATLAELRPHSPSVCGASCRVAGAA